MNGYNEKEMRLHRCCFSGHRPQKLCRPVDDIKVDLENEILSAIQSGYTTFITGMAYGCDIWAGNIVARLKATQPNLKLIAAIPFPEFSEKWDTQWKEAYERLLGSCDYVKYIKNHYENGVYQLRNQWMVDHSGKLLAVYDGKEGGMLNTIRYARRQNVSVTLIQ